MPSTKASIRICFDTLTERFPDLKPPKFKLGQWVQIIWFSEEHNRTMIDIGLIVGMQLNNAYLHEPGWWYSISYKTLDGKESYLSPEQVETAHESDLEPYGIERVEPEEDRDQWVTTEALARAVHYTHSALHDLRNRGTLKNGVHWRNIARPMAARPTYRWNLKACKAALTVPLEEP